MNFIAMQDKLRLIVAEQIREGKLTGVSLAHKTGFRQAHVSNFLNHRRGLSLEAMDRILKVLHLTAVDLLDTAEINLHATSLPPAEGDYDNVPLVEAVAAIAHQVVVRASVVEVLKFRKSFLRRLRPEMESPRDQWLRFVLVKADHGNGLAMQPRMTAGATLVIDRHYNSLRPYRRSSPNIYAVDKGGSLLVRYVELQGTQLLLRPHNQQHPLTAIAIAPGKSFTDYIVGRVCHVAFET